jgi:hypothetical protein
MQEADYSVQGCLSRGEGPRYLTGASLAKLFFPSTLLPNLFSKARGLGYRGI